MNDDPSVEPVELSPTRDELIARVRARGRRIRARRRLAMSTVAALIVVAIAVPAIAIGSRSPSHTVSPAGTTSRTAHALVTDSVTTSIELPGDLTFAAGQVIHGTLIVDNETAAAWPQPVDTNGCETKWAIVLTNAQVPPDAVFTQECTAPFGGHGALPTGVTRLPFTMITRSPTCTTRPSGIVEGAACLPDGSTPPLSPGRYTAVMYGGAGWPQPHGVAVTLVAAQDPR